MPTPIEPFHQEIEELCRRFGVRSLYVFGSAVKGTFDMATSDLDFQVDLGEYAPDVVDRYAGLYEGLASLLQRPIDLITVRATGNPRLLAEIQATRQPIYGA